jgi:hypothetical protein
VSTGSVRTAAWRRTGTEREVVDFANVDMDLHDWRRMEVLVARRRTCVHVVNVGLPKAIEAGKEGCVCSAVSEVAVCLLVGVGVGDVSGLGAK